MSTPTWRAVWKPKVDDAVRQVQVVVDGLGHVRHAERGPATCVGQPHAEKAVSSPPMVISCVDAEPLAATATVASRWRSVARRVGARGAEVRAAA